MIRYNKQDVVLLEKIYLKLRPWIVNHINRNILDGKKDSCPTCKSDNIQRRGFGINLKNKYQRLSCMDCGSWFKGEIIKE